MLRFLLFIGLLLVSVLAFGQREKADRYALPRRMMPLEKALIKLADAGAPLSYRPDQLPKVALKVPGGKRTLVTWLDFLLKDTELTYQAGPAGVLILPDPDLFDREFTTYGVITDKQSGERLIGATVQDLDAGKGILANEYGFYSLLTKGGRKRIRVSYTGYESYDLEVVVRNDQLVDISLSPSASLPPVEVTATRVAEDKLHYTATETSIGNREANLFSAPGGEADVLNVASMLPGITSGANGVGGLAIRGSDAGHNLVLLDGVPVYNLSHAAGLFSIFNSEAVRRADVYKDGLPARFGGRIGGVLDVHTRDGNLYTPEISVGSSLLAANVTAEGPISKGKSSFLLSGRHFWGGGILRDFSERQKQKLNRTGRVDYNVYDLNFKLNQQIGQRGRLYLSLYSGLDEYGNSALRQDSVNLLSQGGAVLRFQAKQQRSEDFSWGNTVGALRYNHVFSDRFFANFRLSYSDLLVRASFERSDSLVERTRQTLSSDISSGRFGSEIEQLGTAFDGQLRIDPEHQIRFGAAVDLHNFLPQLRSGRIPVSSHPELSSLRDAERLRSVGASAYVSFTGQWRKLHYRMGLRSQLWRNNSNLYYWSPRILMAGPVGKRGKWRMTYERLVQPIHLVSSTVVGLPTDLWVPATDRFVPSTSSQGSGTYEHSLKDGWRVSASAYHRDLKNLVDYTETGTNDEWLNKLSVGNGFANGVELTLSKTTGRLQGWLSYTLAESRRRFDEQINLGRPYPYQYDRRHGIKMLATYQLNPAVQLSGVWRYGSGSFYSISRESFLLADPTIIDGTGGQEVNLVESKNGFQLPADHRLDVTAQFQFNRKSGRRFQHTLNVGVYNVYGRINPIYYDLRSRIFGRGFDLVKERQFVQVYLGRIQPTLSYRVRFRGRRE